jgi:hypothetical protein
MPIGVRKDDGSFHQLSPEEEAISVREHAALRQAGIDARVLKAALTRLTNAQKDFARWDRDYQRERAKRLLKIGKLQATVRRLTSQAKSGARQTRSTQRRLDRRYS